MFGRIVKGVGNFFDVFVESASENDRGGEFKNQIVRCNSKGIFRFERDSIKPLVGDAVDISINKYNKDSTLGIIEKIHERKNFLSRPSVANLDILFIVASVKSPDPAYFFIDKLAACAVYNYIEPVIIANKTDLLDGGKDSEKDCEVELYDIYKKAGFKAVKLSALTDADSPGFDEIRNELSGKICAFAGISGAGKSSILNKLFGLNLKTGALSEKLERGRHTTRTVELFRHDIGGTGGYVADTPGFSMLDFDYVDIRDRGIKESTREILKEELIMLFPDLQEYAYSCKYRGCTHLKEEGCAVASAVTKGLAVKSRHESYAELYEQLKGLKGKK